MDRVRIELHMTKEEIKLLDAIGKLEGRSRKNLCETEVRKFMRSYPMLKKKK
jgi:hypothetical protein